MRELIVSLNKRRNQSKNAITEMVKFVLSPQVYDRLNQEEQVKLLKTLIEITEGRIYVELEYSKAVRLLTEIYMSHNQIEEASKLIQDIQIETFGSIERAYKVDYILFQMRILLQKGDYIRTLIVSNKVNRKHLNDEGLEKLKVEFYNLMIRYYLNENKFIEVSKCYKTLYDFVKSINEKTIKNENIKEDVRSNYQEILSQVNMNILFVNYVMYLTICPPELATRNMLNELNISYKKDLEECPDMYMIVTKLLSDDIIYIDNNFLNSFSRYPIFQAGVAELNPEKHFRLFRKYLIQHNLIIFQKFFSQVKLERIGKMIGIDSKEVESEIADMVINNYIYARINRITATVNFKPKSDHNDKLNDINYDLMKMLEKIETTCHLIHKENLKHDIK